MYLDFLRYIGVWYTVEKLLTWALRFSFYNIISDRQIDSMGDTSPQPTIPKDEGLKKNEAFFQAMEDNVQVAKDPLSLRKPVNLPSVDIIKERANAGNSQVPMVNASKDWTPGFVKPTPSSLLSNLHPASYSSFANSYLENMTGSTAIMVNPNNVMPIHPLQHQQVTQPTQPPQQVYSATQRPAKSVRVLPSVSSPMQQVKKSHHIGRTWDCARKYFEFSRLRLDLIFFFFLVKAKNERTTTFALIHGSQKDPLAADSDAPQRLLQPILSKEEGQKRKAEEREFGVFYRDDYDYF